MNDFSEYQDLSSKTAYKFADGTGSDDTRTLSEKEQRLMFLALAINGEAGEIAEKVKKRVREDDESYIENLEAELGDVTWYLAQLATLLDADFGDDVAFANLEKLFDRDERDVIEGSGDDR